MNLCSGYLWKWADNDLPGRPKEVFAKLLQGEMHPALQCFDPEPIVRLLETASQAGQAAHEEWSWQVCLDGEREQARFIHLACLLKDNPDYSQVPLQNQLLTLGISGCDEDGSRIIGYLLPKLNVFQGELWGGEPSYDIDANEMAVLLRRLNPSDCYNHSPLLYDRRGNYVQCIGYGRRYVVEWHEKLGSEAHNPIVSWRLECVSATGKRRHFIPAGVEYRVVKGHDSRPRVTGESDHETITFSETLAVLRSFLRGEPRPSRYQWRNITWEVA
jgi:hypothetical protein